MRGQNNKCVVDLKKSNSDLRRQKKINSQLVEHAEDFVPKIRVLNAINDVLAKYSKLHKNYTIISGNLNRCDTQYNAQLNQLQNMADQYVEDLNKFKEKCLHCAENIDKEKNLTEINNKKALRLYSKVQNNRWTIGPMLLIICILIVLIILRLYRIF
jgi:DNA repair ATPase RecN